MVVLSHNCPWPDVVSVRNYVKTSLEWFKYKILLDIAVWRQGCFSAIVLNGTKEKVKLIIYVE